MSKLVLHTSILYQCNHAKQMESTARSHPSVVIQLTVVSSFFVKKKELKNATSPPFTRPSANFTKFSGVPPCMEIGYSLCTLVLNWLCF